MRNLMQAFDIYGARSRNRTGTPLRAGDFKSHASTSFAIRAVALCSNLEGVNQDQAIPEQLRQGEEYIHPFALKQGRRGLSVISHPDFFVIKKLHKSLIYRIRPTMWCFARLVPSPVWK